MGLCARVDVVLVAVVSACRLSSVSRGDLLGLAEGVTVLGLSVGMWMLWGVYLALLGLAEGVAVVSLPVGVDVVGGSLGLVEG